MRVVTLFGFSPRRPGHSLQRQDSHLFLLRLLNDLGPEVRLREEYKINWEQNRIEVETVHCCQRTSTECAEKPINRAFPAFLADSRVSMAPCGPKIWSSSDILVRP